jgi:hypothetical protein
MEESRADAPTSGSRFEISNGKAFTWFVYFVPFLLVFDWPPTRILGFVALAYVLRRRWSTTRRDPVLLAFLGFALAVMFANGLGGRELHAAAVPYTGWLAATPYDGSIFFAVVGLALGIPRARFVVVAMCLLQVAMGSYDWVTAGARWSSNPYLRVSVWRPAWTVFIPLAWVVVILLFRPRAADVPTSA